MFALHETTQRRVCRIVFLTLCIVPTLLTLVGIAYCNRPWRQTDWQRMLTQKLHVRATLGDISRPLPGVTVLTNLCLSDLRFDEALGSIGKLDMRRQDSRLLLHADHLEIQAEQLPALTSAVSIWLATSEKVPLDFLAERLTVVGPAQQAVELKDFSIRSDSANAPRQRFRVMARNPAGEIIELTLTSERNTLSCAINTQQVSLPAWLVGKLVPGASGFGEAEFSGVISAESENLHFRQRVRGKLVGKFEQVDLQTWIGDDCPHRLQGSARVELQQLLWVDERIETAQGKIQAGNGASSFLLLLNAKDLCGCVPGPKWGDLSPSTLDELVFFDELALSFQMSRAGITFAGECENGGVIRAEGASLLFAPSQEPKETVLPVGQLVLLLDDRRPPGWLPATLSAHTMAGKLPLPGKEARESENLQR